MGKQKYYVVTVGRAVGVFDNWLKVASLVSGISGALHQSFPTKEQAIKVFNEERENGNTRVVAGPEQPFTRNTPFASPVISVNSSPQTPPRTPVRSNVSTPRMSSPRIPSGPPSQSRSRHGPVQSVPPTRTRSRSPPIFYDNVSYSRGASSTPRSSPRDARRASPRVVVETPIDLASYASDTESNSSASSYQESSPLTRHSSRNHIQVSTSQRRTPSTPLTSKEKMEKRTPRMVGRVMVETPPGLKHYPIDEGDALDYYTPVHKSVQASSSLSPISSPRLRTPKDADVNISTSRSSTPRSRTSSSASSSSKFSPKLPPGIPPVNIYFICPEAHHSRCHRCEEYPTRHAASSMSQFGLSHSIRPSTVQGVPEIDPRSPLSRSGSAHSALFTRPSPINVEEQMSNMFL